MNPRISNLFRLCAVAAAVLISFTAYWQIWAAPGLAARRDNARLIYRQLQVRRGLIFAANGRTALARNIERIDGVMVQPSQEPESVTLIKVAGGFLHDPVPFHVTPRLQVGRVKTPQSMEARLSETLASVPEQKPSSAYEWMEHLALLKRWYYRSSKTGEIFLTDEKGDLPYRRLVRGVSRVYKGEKPQGDLSETAGDYWRFRAAEGGVPDQPSEARGGLGTQK